MCHEPEHGGAHRLRTNETAAICLARPHRVGDSNQSFLWPRYTGLPRAWHPHDSWTVETGRTTGVASSRRIIFCPDISSSVLTAESKFDPGSYTAATTAGSRVVKTDSKKSSRPESCLLMLCPVSVCCVAPEKCKGFREDGETNLHSSTACIPSDDMTDTKSMQTLLFVRRSLCEAEPGASNQTGWVHTCCGSTSL